MFNVGAGEFLVIALIALIVLGPQKLPDAARQAGRWMNELRRMSAGFQQEMRDAFEEHSGVEAGKAVDTLKTIASSPLAPSRGPIRTGLNAAVAAVSTQASAPAPLEPTRAATKRTTKKAPVKKAPTRKAPAKKAVPARKATPVKKAAPTKKAPAKKAGPAKKAVPAKRAPRT